MTQKFIDLRARVKNAEIESTLAKAALQGALCAAHTWGEPTYTPITTKGYTTPGDPPGTMGVDRRSSFYVAPTETPQWTRECKVCGHIEVTKTTTKEVREKPVF